MKGVILHVTDELLIIRAENQEKYEVSLSEIKSQLTPHEGDEVDFELSEQGAHSVYILRKSHTLDDHIEKTKEVAGNLYGHAKNSINEENIQKAKEFASDAANKAKESLKKVDLSKARNILPTSEQSHISKFPLYNKFSVVVLVTVFIAMILPLVKIPFAGTQSYFQLVEGVSLQVIFLILSLIGLIIGLPRFFTRICSVLFLITLCLPIYDAYNYLDDMRQMTSASKFTKEAYKMLQIGVPMLAIASFLYALIQILPWYQTNPKFLKLRNDKE